MPKWRISDNVWGWNATAPVTMMIAAAHAAVLVLDPAARSLAGLVAVSALIMFSVVLAAAVLTYIHWRIAGEQIAAWLTVCLAVVAAPNLTLAGVVVSDAEAAHINPTSSLVVQALIMLAIMLIALLSTRDVAVDPLGLGIALGLLLSVLTAALVLRPLSELSDDTLHVLRFAPLLGSVVLAQLLRSRDELPARARVRLALAIMLVAVAQFASQAPRSDLPAVTAELVALVLGAGLIGCTSSALVRSSLRENRRNTLLLHDRLTKSEATVRLDRARMHEIGATVAGIASASRLISDPPVQLPVHRRTQLGDMIESEVARLERLMLGESGAERVFDLDETIRRLAVRQQVQGQPVTWVPGDHRVLGCPDDVTEVLSILLDNAAKHGRRAPVTVEVTSFDGDVEISVTDEGPGVSPDVLSHLFDWGVRGVDSSGQGIGLNIARDLAEKQGGYLMLADSPGPGTTFVVGLLSGERNDAVGYIAG